MIKPAFSYSENEGDEMKTGAPATREVTSRTLGHVVAVKEADVGLSTEVVKQRSDSVNRFIITIKGENDGDEMNTEAPATGEVTSRSLGHVVAVKEADVGLPTEVVKQRSDPCRLGLRKAVEDCPLAGVNIITVDGENDGDEVNNDAPAELMSRSLGQVNSDGTDNAPQGLKEADTPAPLSSTSVTQTLPLRPGSGSIGEPHIIRSNHFSVDIQTSDRALLELKNFDERTGRDEEKLIRHDTLLMLHKLLKKMASQCYSISGRYYFGLSSKGTGKIDGDLGMGIQYSRGLFRALRLTQDGLHLNADVITKCCYESINLAEFVGKYLLNTRQLDRELTEEEHAKLEKALRSIEVELTYFVFPRKAKIEGISTVPIHLLTFNSKKTGTVEKVTEYFSSKYSREVKYTNLPAIRIGIDAYVPMEFCRIIAGQQYREGLSQQQATAFRKVSLQRPEHRERTIVSMLMIDKKHALSLVNNELKGVMRVSDELAKIDARVLPPPMLKYRDNYSGEEQTVTPKLGKWSMHGKKMIEGATVANWACVNFSSRDQHVATTFCRELAEKCCNLGMIFRKTPVIPVSSYQPTKIEEALRDIHKKAINLQMLIVILPDVTGSYGKIKKLCETELGIVSQCIQPNNASKRDKRFLESLALKINLKAGGRNYVLQKQISLITEKPTIIFGADVTHPTVAGQLSLAAVVASMDWPDISTYRALVSAQTGKQEIIQDLYKCEAKSHTGMIRDHLLAFNAKTGKQPQKLIFFRDGVGETQFEQVLRLELPKIREACSSLGHTYKPPITFVVVQKRHHTRFFPTKADVTNKSGNVLPGTVVDTTICHPYQFDFYLNSHPGVMGTSKPTHYYVLADENGFSSDDLQGLTNSLGYTFAKTTSSVSLVTPVYYAHLAAFRARYYMEGEMPALHLPAIQDEVKEKMYFC